MRVAVLVACAAGPALLGVTLLARSWRAMASAVAVCPVLFCDFADYFLPMGAAVFRTARPVAGFLYSPFAALVFAAFAALDGSQALLLWGALQIAAVGLCVLLFRALVRPDASTLLLFAALTVFSVPAVLNLAAGSVSLFLMAATFGMLAADRRGHRFVAATLLALAVSFKFYPALFTVLFAARRDARSVLASCAACCALLFVVPAVVLGPVDTLGFYGGLADAFRASGWIASNVHSQYLPHVLLRWAGGIGLDAGAGLPVLHALALGVALANVALVFAVQRAQGRVAAHEPGGGCLGAEASATEPLRRADLWSFQLLFLTIPFVLKTSWPHDFVFLSFAQAWLARWLVEGRGRASERDTAEAGPRRQAVTALLLASVAVTNVGFFAALGVFEAYGFLACPLWANVFLLAASYIVLWPAVARRAAARPEAVLSIP